MKPDEKIVSLNIDIQDYKAPVNLAPAVRVGSTIYCSGHGSIGFYGKLGQDFTIAEGKEAARLCGVQLLQAVHTIAGSLNQIRCVKLVGFVNCTPHFVEPHLVINGVSELMWDVFKEHNRGYHARSALGFASLPKNYAVEVEAIFEILDQV
ncbi:MAG: RidA family protein [Chloroflexota bacterium]